MNSKTKAEDIERLHTIIKKTRSIRIKSRCLIIYHYLKGYKIDEVANLNLVSKCTVNRYVKLYKEGGIAAS